MAQTSISTVVVDGQGIRVGIKKGARPALLVFNGIGANFELLEPFTQALDGVETIVFDVPGVGGSAPPLSPYRLSGLARLFFGSVADEVVRGGEVPVLLQHAAAE